MSLPTNFSVKTVAYSVKFLFVSALLGVHNFTIFVEMFCTEGISVSKLTLISIRCCRNFSIEGRNEFVFFGCNRYLFDVLVF